MQNIENNEEVYKYLFKNGIPIKVFLLLLKLPVCLCMLVCLFLVIR